MTFDARILALAGKDSEKEVRSLAVSVFGTPEGARLLTMLVHAAHPMQPRFASSDAMQAAILDGECNVTSFLWRMARGNSLPTEPQQTKP